MRNKRALALTFISAFLLLLTAGSQAQERGSDSLAFQPKSEATALMLSLSGTVVPVGAALAKAVEPTWVITGIFLGPSLGYFYGGEVGRGLKGIAIRGSVAAASLLVGAELGLEFNIFDSGDADDEGWPIVILGAAFVTGQAIYDIATVHRAVRKHNLQLQERSLSVVPTYLPDSDAPGLALQLAF